MPLYPRNVASQGAHPNSFSFRCLHLWTHSWVHQGAWGCVNGGMNMRGSSVGHPKGPTCGLKGGSPGESPLDELALGEFASCPPSSGWWLEPLGMWIGKLIRICIVVGIGAITSCWTSCLSLLVTGWIPIGNWFSTKYGIYVGGITCWNGSLEFRYRWKAPTIVNWSF
jgi:hypothetical protein